MCAPDISRSLLYKLFTKDTHSSPIRATCGYLSWVKILTKVYIRSRCALCSVIMCDDITSLYYQCQSLIHIADCLWKQPIDACVFSCVSAATKQLYEWFSPSVCPSVRHTFLTMFPSSYHHENFRSYYQGQKWRPCKRSRSEVKGQGNRGHNPT